MLRTMCMFLQPFCSNQHFVTMLYFFLLDQVVKMDDEDDNMFKKALQQQKEMQVKRAKEAELRNKAGSSKGG